MVTQCQMDNYTWNIGQLPPPPAYDAIDHSTPPQFDNPPPALPAPVVESRSTPGPLALQSTIARVTKETDPVSPRNMKILYKLSRVMVGPGLVLLTVGVGLSALALQYPTIRQVCVRPGASTWVGAVTTVTAICGMYTFGKCRRRMVSAFFVLVILTAAGCGGLVLMAFSSIYKASRDIQIVNTLENDETMVNREMVVRILTWVIVSKSVVVAMALFTMISALAAGSVICGLWCKDSPTTMTVIYIHPQMIPHIRRVDEFPPNQ